MRHLKAGRRLGVTTSHRKAMLRNLVTAILEHGQIKTSLARAKEMRKYLDKMITLAKVGDLHSRRKALAFVKTKKAMSRLFDEYAGLYMERNGGYSRIHRIGFRLGDNASMVLMSLVDLEKLDVKMVDDNSTTPVSPEKESDIKELKKELEVSTEGEEK